MPTVASAGESTGAGVYLHGCCIMDVRGSRGRMRNPKWESLPMQSCRNENRIHGNVEFIPDARRAKGLKCWCIYTPRLLPRVAMAIFTSCSQCDGEKGEFNPENPPGDDAWSGRELLPYHRCYANVATMTQRAGKHRVIKSSGPLRCLIVCWFWIVRLIIRFATTWNVVFPFLFTVFPL